MIVPYDILFDEKVDRAAENISKDAHINENGQLSEKQCRQVARLTLLTATRVEAEHKDKKCKGEK